nr:MAG TPA: hypothetical protein [Caudoviricetes sp.]
MKDFIVPLMIEITASVFHSFHVSKERQRK